MKHLLLILLLFLSGCRNAWIDPDKDVYIDPQDTKSTASKSIPDSSNIIRVAVASMTTPAETMNQYDQLFKYLETRLHKKIVLVQRKTYKEVNNLLKNNYLQFAFICSGAYVTGYADSAFNIFLIPQHYNETHYHAYVIAKADAPYKSFNDLRGKRFVFSDSISNTGMFYPLKRLSDLNSNPNDFFSHVYMSNAHDNSIELVRRGIIDAASVNSLIYDYTKSVYPEKVTNIKIIEKSEPFGMPPIVVSKKIDPTLRDSLYGILTNMNHDPEGNQILRGLMIDKYIQASNDQYNSIRKMCSQIDYPTSITNGNDKSLSRK